MIIVTGSVKAQPATQAQLRELCLEHVHRSRTEPGCLLHSVHHDVEDPLQGVEGGLERSRPKCRPGPSPT